MNDLKQLVSSATGLILIAAAIGAVAVLLAKESCRDKIIYADPGIEDCSGFEKTAYEDSSVLLVGVGVVALIAIGLTRK